MTQKPGKESPLGQWPPPKQYWLYAFQGTGQNPDNWRYRAGVLKKAADLALKQMKADEDATIVGAGWVDSVYKYLAGMTVENIVKGIIVAENPDLISEKKMLGGLDSHKTWTKHADKLKAIAPLLTQEEEELVKVLEHHMMWKGRYPIAKNAEDYANSLVELQKLDRLSRARLEEVFDSLCKKLFKELDDRCKTYLKDRFGMPI